MSWSVLSPVVALGATLLAMLAAIAFTTRRRSRDYRRFEDRSREELGRKFPIPSIAQSAAEERRNALSQPVNKVHQSANQSQTRYHHAVVGSAACIAVAFVALVLGSLPEEVWQAMPVRHSDVERVLTWIDAIAIITVLILFYVGGWANRQWLRARAGTELLRQYQFLSVVFPIPGLGPEGDESQFDREADAIKARVQDGSVSEIIARIEGFWSERRASIAKRSLEAEFHLPTDALLMYLRRRALRQQGWFRDSKARLERLANRRKRLLLGLYLVSVAIAAVKLVLFLRSGHSPWFLLPTLLIMTGISATMTAYYVNLNARSLIHRYNTQERRITQWLEEFNGLWSFANLPSARLDAAAKADICARILQFEDVMIEELIDWTHITSHDTIELAP